MYRIKHHLPELFAIFSILFIASIKFVDPVPLYINRVQLNIYSFWHHLTHHFALPNNIFRRKLECYRRLFNMDFENDRKPVYIEFTKNTSTRMSKLNYTENNFKFRISIWDICFVLNITYHSIQEYIYVKMFIIKYFHHTFVVCVCIVNRDI